LLENQGETKKEVFKCNMALDQVDDNPEILKSMILYLERYKKKEELS